MKKTLVIGAVSCMLLLAVFEKLSRAQTACTQYLPDTGTFLMPAFTLVPSNPTTASPYSISLNNQHVLVKKGTNTVADVAIPVNFTARFLFYGLNNRFLILDTRNPNSAPVQFTQVVLDLENATQTTLQSVSTDGLVHIFPSPGNGLAFFVWYGLTGGMIQKATIFRSDTGKEICSAPDFTATQSVSANATSTAMQILDGTTVKAGCSVPIGRLTINPAVLDFGTILADSTSLKGSIFKNIGDDCISISSISDATHFQLNPPFAAFDLPPGGSKEVRVRFNPASAFGTFTEPLTVMASPASPFDLFIAKGTSDPPAHLTVTKNLSPAADPGRFNLWVSSGPLMITKVALDVGNMGNTGRIPVNPGTYDILESAVTPGTNLGDYSTSIKCTPRAATSATLPADVTLIDGDDETCIVTNLGRPQLRVSKILAPVGDPGRFDLQVDGTTLAMGVGGGGGGASGPLSVGMHSVQEVPAPGTDMTQYTSTINCTPKTNTPTGITLDWGDDETCTFTNLGKPRLAVYKFLLPQTDTGLFNIMVDGGMPRNSRPLRNASSTGPIVLDPGNHSVTEAPIAQPKAHPYTTVFSGSCNAKGQVNLSRGDDKHCTLFNIDMRESGKVTPQCYAKCFSKYESCFTGPAKLRRPIDICYQEVLACTRFPSIECSLP